MNLSVGTVINNQHLPKNLLGRKAEKGSRGEVDSLSKDSEREAESISCQSRLYAARFRGCGYFGVKPNTHSTGAEPTEASSNTSNVGAAWLIESLGVNHGVRCERGEQGYFA
jgi:hypothetical protein